MVMMKGTSKSDGERRMKMGQCGSAKSMNEEKKKILVNEVITYLGQRAVAHHEEHAVICVAGDIEHGAVDLRSSLRSSRAAAGRAHSRRFFLSLAFPRGVFPQLNWGKRYL